MAYRTPDDAAGLTQRAPIGHDAVGVGSSVVEASADAAVMLPSGRFASDSSYQQQGDDLVLTVPDGKTFVVESYFLLGPPPNLLTPEGGRLTPAMVDSFTPPESAGQYAQAGQLAQAAEPIGQISDIVGDVSAVRADGTRVRLWEGDAVFEGDVVETAAGGAVNMIFVDDTNFALGANARLALDEMAYNPATQSGSSSFAVLKGVFVFVSGQIAQTDNTQMIVTTPIATIGIRGTKVAGDVRPAEEESSFTVIDGEIAISTQGGTAVMSQANETTVVTSFLDPPRPPVVYTTDQLNNAYNSVRSVSNYTSSSDNSGSNDKDLLDVTPPAGRESGEGDGGGYNLGGQISSSGDVNGDGGETLTGKSDADVFSAGTGKHFILGGRGADLMHDSDGDEVFVAPDTGFGRIEGGNGFDTIRFAASDGSFDLTGLSGDLVNAVEAIDLSSFGENIPTLNLDSVFAAKGGENALTGTKRSFVIDGESSDTVEAGTGTVNIGGDGYSVYESDSGDAQLYINASMDVNAA